MAYQYLFDPNKQFQNVTGVNNVAGFLRVFYNGTDDRPVTYKDFNGTANPADIPIDINGRAVVIVNEDMVYRLEVYNRDGALLWSQYPLSPMGGGGGGDPTTITSRDGSVTIEKTGLNYDLSVARAIDGAVLYSEQDKTEAQKATARDNIGAQQKLTAGANLNVDNNTINVNSDSCTTNSTTSVALGSHTVANGTGQVVVGKYNATSNSDLFQVGGGADDNARKNLLYVQRDGKLYINTETHATDQSSIIYDGYYYGSDLIAPAREGFTRLAAWKDSGSVSNAHGFDVRIDSADNTFSNIISSQHFKLVWISGNVAVKYLAGNSSWTQITNGILLDLGGGSGQEISPRFPQIPIPDNTWMYNSVSAPYFLPNPYTYSTAPLMLHFGKSAAAVGTETDISYSYSFVLWGIL